MGYITPGLDEKSTSATAKQKNPADYQEAQVVVNVLSPDFDIKSTTTTKQQMISKYSFHNAKNHISMSTKADYSIGTSSDFLHTGISKSNDQNNGRFKININPCLKRHKRSIVGGILIILVIVIVAFVVASVTSNARTKAVG
ncbi:uncharacterized protein LOC128174375 [Crassostrea angulata]|uniref:uncharacterized protein LOC128174375 n=1 Tax=Magallana angulata TaxID=2784310 RepID=UPI0022B13E39|nr:uncharacterized protein LOC128174375 [Crassostrea angulata]